MEHVYTVQTKIIHDKTYYFVKKILALPEFPGLAELVVGYGMHTDFDKACNIAGIKDIASRQKLLFDLEKHVLPAQSLQETKPAVAPKQAVRHPIKITDMINNWLALRGAEMLN
ncbi:MAG: hypothetical protein IPH68_13120 [Chitinophagaceae bacterium]|nr:hypothetical protein [Chitinophagaceae bacterium]MBK7123659.1 hypothetical protein [Chitinophagaceae bacterium]MBK7557834.1 hypothetical protein [Chitinophagaceae bacterium]MBK9531521.1 hypothetical protein [Chitinophagaceae bacterium]HQW93165.1 hypothetical protein [Ferruginibacter sp.]